jgi:hypothetical protein
LRTVDEQRTREDEQNEGGDDDGKEQAIHQSQAMAPASFHGGCG